MTDRSLEDRDPAATALEEAASGFEQSDEKTSPEVVAHRRKNERAPQEPSNPICVVAVGDTQRRKKLVELLKADGWNAIEATGPDELFEVCRALAPQVALIDARMSRPDGWPVPEALHSQRPDVALRTVALLPQASSFEIAAALADGYDDFVSDGQNEVEILSRCTANLRGSRALAELGKQRRDAGSLLELSQTLASSLDMQLILHTVSRLIAEVIGLERCSIVLLDPDHDEAVMVAASEDRAVKDLRINLPQYPELVRCVESAAPVLIDDTAADPIVGSVRSALIEKNVRMMALFPIVFEERVTGVLFMRSSQTHRRLTDMEVAFAQTVASHCAVAIRNARLFDQFRDQTEHLDSMRVLAERQMEALKKYEDFFEYAADGMAILDAEARVLYVNREGRRLLGREREQLRKALFVDFLADESKELWPEVVDQVRHGRFKRSFDVYALRGDDQERVFSLSAGGVGQETGLVILSFRDVTETREMEMELRTTKEFLENLIDNSVDAIVAADMNGNIMLFNKGAEKIFGWKADDVIGRMHVSQLYPAGVATDIMRMLRDERWGGRGRLEAQRREIVSHAGNKVPVSMTASIIYEDGEEVATVGVYTDLRDRITIERRLSEAQDELMKAEKARVAAELAGMAAHELNQPLTSVLGYAEMLRNKVPETDGGLRRPIDTIFKQAERMAEIVRKIGRITKYETKPYGANTNIIDINQASAPDPGMSSAEADTGKNPSSPRRETSGPHAASPKGTLGKSPGLVAALAGTTQPTDAERAAIVRPDTVDETKIMRREPASDENTTRYVRAPSQPMKASPPPSRAPTPRSVALNDQVPQGQTGKGGDDDTNPGVKMTDVGPPQPSRRK